MPDPGGDRVLLRGGVHEIVISRSRFRAALARVPDEAAATAFVAGVRREHWTATHHCTAWRLGVGGARSRSAVDGSGTCTVIVTAAPWSTLAIRSPAARSACSTRPASAWATSTRSTANGSRRAVPSASTASATARP